MFRFCCVESHTRKKQSETLLQQLFHLPTPTVCSLLNPEQHCALIVLCLLFNLLWYPSRPLGQYQIFSSSDRRCRHTSSYASSAEKEQQVEPG